MCFHIKLIQSLRVRTTYVKSFRMLKNPRTKRTMIKCDSILLVAVVDVDGLGSNSNLIWRVSQHNTKQLHYSLGLSMNSQLELSMKYISYISADLCWLMKRNNTQHIMKLEVSLLYSSGYTAALISFSCRTNLFSSGSKTSINSNESIFFFNSFNPSRIL